MSQNPLISIVVTSYTMERFKDICDLFDSIKKQTIVNPSEPTSSNFYRPSNDNQPASNPYQSPQDSQLEVVFVAERSMELYEKVKEYGERIFGGSGITFKVFFNDREPGANASRNLGIVNAKGEIIGFVDDDVVLFPDWAEAMIETYQDESVIGVTGPAYPLWQDNPIAWLPEELYWLINCTNWANWDCLREVRNIWAMNASFRKEAFDVARFAESLGPHGGGIEGWKRGLPEEIELSLRIVKGTGKRIVYNPMPKVWHKVYKYKLRLKYMLSHAYLMGFSRYKTWKLYSEVLSSGKVLLQEKQLLWHILRKGLLCAAGQVFRNPLLACQKFIVTVVVLGAVAIGYLTAAITRA